MLTAPQVLTVLDSLAEQVRLFELAMGLTGAEAGTVSRGAANNLATVQALADDDASVHDLLPLLAGRSSRVRASSLYHTIGARDVARVLEAHLAPAGGLNTFLKDNAAMVHPNVLRLGVMVDPDRVFIPANLDLVEYTLTGDSVGNMAQLAQVDGAVYGDALLAVVTQVQTGPAAIEATIRTVNRAGQQTDQVVVIPAASVVGARAVLAIRGQRVVSIVVAGGTAADRFRVRAETERATVL